MRDKLYLTFGGRDTPVPYEKTVIEKRAPTDDSIRLYEEIKTKAYKSIIDRYFRLGKGRSYIEKQVEAALDEVIR